MKRNVEEITERANDEDKLSAVLMLIAAVALLGMHVLSIVAGPLGRQSGDAVPPSTPPIHAEATQSAT